jgi:hypothetical protein
MFDLWPLHTQDLRPVTIALQANLTSGKGGAGLGSLHTTLQGPTE